MFSSFNIRSSKDFFFSSLNDLIKTLVDYPKIKVLISGNVTLDADDAKKVTLDLPNATYVNGKPSSIRGLMLSRANAIKRFFIRRGVNPSQISTSSGAIKTEGNMNATFKLTR